MLKKSLKHASLLVQGTYSAFCILDMVLCLIYYFHYDTALGERCAYLALDLTCVLFFMPALPVGLILNLLAFLPKQPDETQRGRWLIWTILSPCLYVAVYFLTVCVFVATTGGV